MKKIDQERILVGLRNCLKKIELRNEDFEERAGTASLAHSKTARAIEQAFRQSQGFGQASDIFRAVTARAEGGPGLDIEGRRSSDAGILLALEIDNDWNDSSALKLADVKAAVKVWVFIEEDYEDEVTRAEQSKWFKEWLPKQARDFREHYKDLESGEITFFFKTPMLLWESELP
jgi:hypothetical protein